MVGVIDILGPEAALLVLPFAIYAVIWALARIFLGDVMGEPNNRVEPPSPNYQSRVIPGGRDDRSK